MRIIHDNIEDSLLWENPKDNSKIELGQMIAKDIVINPEHKNFLAHVLPLETISFEKKLGWVSDGEVYLSRIGDKQFALKKYGNKDFCFGLTQFRCLRKIRLLGYNTPEVYAATDNILLMDYIPNQTIEQYIHVKNKGGFREQLKGQKVYDLWKDQMFKIIDTLWDENMDASTANGYVIKDSPEIKLGMFDQG